MDSASDTDDLLDWIVLGGWLLPSSMEIAAMSLGMVQARMTGTGDSLGFRFAGP